jgi:tRNA threonylcarbamoyladenosine biosynthesis protein TsaE
VSQEFVIESVEELAPIAKLIIAQSRDCPVILLIGEMGTGKTTLAKEIMRQLGVKETSSPTFSLVNQYDTSSGTWYHFDLYRVEDEEELLDFGFEEYLSSGKPCLIEWPQIASGYIEAPYLRIELELESNRRKITVDQIAL